MTIPWREWKLFHQVTLEGLDDTAGRDWNREIDWTINHFGFCKIGHRREAGPLSWRWDPLIKPSEASYERPAGMDEPCAFSITTRFQQEANTVTPPVITFQLLDGILRLPISPNIWHPNTCSGRYYENTTVWGAAWPHTRRLKGSNYTTITMADLPLEYVSWYPPGPANTWREELFRNGYIITATNYNPGWPAGWANGEECSCSFVPDTMHVQYLNSVTNSITPKFCRTLAGQIIIFNGMGFNNTNADIKGGWPNIANTDDDVEVIYFIRKGDGLTYTYTQVAGTPASGQFHVDSNLQITLVTLAMQAGSYEVLLKKQNVKIGGQARIFDIEDYAGDWSVEPDGRVWRIGEDARGRITFLVTDEYMDPEGDPRAKLTGGKMGGAGSGGAAGTGANGSGSGAMFLTDWQFENLLGEESLKHYSKLDTRAPDKFYEGRILAAPSITRATDDMIGLPAIADMTIDLANHDLAMTKIMAQYLIVNRYVSLFAGFGNEPDAWRAEILRCIVDDHEDMGPNWRFYLKDISKKYGAIKIPKYFITEDEYPNCHDDAKGKPMNDILGLHTLDSGDDKGACKAYCTDTTTFEYLAARGSLHSITNVYADGGAPAGAWAVVYKDGGRTYIDFTVTQGDAEITFDCTGYMHAPWNDATGYVRNPAYILAFLISLIAEVPIELLVTAAFDELATLFVNLGWHQTGRLQIPLKGDDFCKLDDAIGELCFTFGMKIWFDMWGRYKVGKKTLENLNTDLIFFDEQDALKPAIRKPHLRKAVNYARVIWDYYPNADRFLGADEDTKQSSVDGLKATREDSRTPWEFKWTDSEDVIADRMEELLIQRAYGYPRIYFSLPMVWFKTLDIFDNFWYQSAFGPSTTGDGEKQHLYYIESITYDFDGNKMDIVGVDLSHLMAQCMIIGRCADLTANYNLAQPWMRMFGYIGRCAEGTFANGDPNKLICKCDF